MTAPTKRKFAVYRLVGSKPGCVDFLTEIECDSAGEAEASARLMYDFDWASGDRIDIEEIEE